MWTTCLACDLTASGIVALRTFFFRIQITEYSQELFPEAADEASWLAVLLLSGALLVVLLLDTLMLAAAAVKLAQLNKIQNTWMIDGNSSDELVTVPLTETRDEYTKAKLK